MSSQFHPILLKEKIKETKDTVSLRFSIPMKLRENFSFKAGQYLTLKFTIGSQDVRRAYSMSSSPLEEDVIVTVKRVKGGLVSNHIHDVLAEGDEIQVMPPQGRFVAEIKEENRKTYYMMGAGSGITPLMSMIRTILEQEPQSSIFLFYGNRDEESIIFKNALDALGKRYRGQLPD